MKRLVVGIDGSATSVAALRWAVAEAARAEARVEAWHAWQAPFAGREQAPPDERALETAARSTLDGALSSAGAGDAEPVLVRAVAASALLDAARGADLLVVGHGGGSGLGSVSRHVVEHASCPVVVVPGGWE